jgi:hypothetical protein
MKRTHPRHKSRKQRRDLKNKTQKNRKHAQCSKEQIVETFLEMLNEIKVYHWNTHSFSQHKATDELYQRLNDHIDKFVEVLLGKREARIGSLGPLNLSRGAEGAQKQGFVLKRGAKKLVMETSASKKFKTHIYEFREYLIKMDSCAPGSDLLNIRDEILADINQFLYLLSLK